MSETFSINDEVIISFNGNVSYGTVRAVEPRYVKSWMLDLVNYKHMTIGEQCSQLVTVEERLSFNSFIGKSAIYDSKFLSINEVPICVGELEEGEEEIEWID